MIFVKMARSQQINLKEVLLNESNPRTISDKKFDALVDSILSFPTMLELRPVVVDDNNVVLGGNMRARALMAIASMSLDGIGQRLGNISSFNSKTDNEQQIFLSNWAKWLKDPSVLVVNADKLSDNEKRQFIIADNVSFGEWDWDKLANEWDPSELDEWGLDTWQPADSFDKEDEEADNGGGNGDSGSPSAIICPHCGKAIGGEDDE